MRMPNQNIVIGTGAPRISRKCAACEEEENLQAKPVAASLLVPTSIAADVHHLLRTPGQPLDPGTRQFFEPRFGRGFADVRIHADEVAQSSARQLGAHAYAIGSDIAFAAGRYAPHSAEGRRLLAHELTHVVQQSGNASTTGRTVVRRQPDDSHSHASPGLGAGVRAQVPYEKWSPQIEAQYRQRGDALRANAIRDCRELGGSACDRLLTLTEVNALYQVAQDAKGDEHKVRMGLMGPLAGVGTLGYVSAAALSQGTAATTAPAAAAAGGAGGAAGAAAVAGPLVIVGICVIAGIQLWKLGQFEEALRQKGFVILADPLGLCIGGCHMPSHPAAPTFPTFDLPGEGPTFGPRPLSDADRKAIETWLTPPVTAGPQPDATPATETGTTAVPAPDTKEQQKKTCATEMPSVPLCTTLPRDYTFASPAAALRAIKATNKEYTSARLEKRAVTTSGPCEGKGDHIAVRSGGDYIASIVCCPCCEDTPAGPKLTNRCAIRWH
jgi:hypothetical protein